WPPLASKHSEQIYKGRVLFVDKIEIKKYSCNASHVRNRKHATLIFHPHTVYECLEHPWPH
ncbi:10221_t:CDS:1, partial [Scutellospora calospora]